jgi:hypothetical protein
MGLACAPKWTVEPFTYLIERATPLVGGRELV